MKFEQLVKIFDHIKSEWNKDTEIDFQFKNKEYTEDLARLSLEIPFQHNKYLNHYTDLNQIKTS
ncbi:MAG: recombination mediator protein UvsY, partial [Candidatus Nanopelagicaceae bacterium]